MARMRYEDIRDEVQGVVREDGGQMAHEALINALDPPLPSYVPRLVRAGDLVPKLTAVGGEQSAQLTYHLPGMASETTPESAGDAPTEPEPATQGMPGAERRPGTMSQ